MKYRLTKEELARQIHQALRERYQGMDSIAVLREFLIEDEAGITFNVKEFAIKNDLEGGEILSSLYIELGIEFEKNLHDKFYFMMTKDDESLYFKMIEDE